MYNHFSTLSNSPVLSYHSYGGWTFEPEEIDIVQYLSLDYSPQEKAKFANLKLHLVEEVALKMPSGKTPKAQNTKGMGESIQVNVFMSPSCEFLGSLHILDQSQLYFPDQ